MIGCQTCKNREHTECPGCYFYSNYVEGWSSRKMSSISFPILNNLTPTVESCTMKVLEEVGELMQLIGKGQGKSGEQGIMRRPNTKWAVDTVCESLDVAQSAITLAHTLCKLGGFDLEELMELHESKLKDRGYLK